MAFLCLDRMTGGSLCAHTLTYNTDTHTHTHTMLSHLHLLMTHLRSGACSKGLMSAIRVCVCVCVCVCECAYVYHNKIKPRERLKLPREQSRFYKEEHGCFLCTTKHSTAPWA